MASVSCSEVCDGPVLSLITKKLRALKKKYTRIIQLEESQAQGKTLIKEQEDLLKSKLAVSALIDEYEKLRQPLASAVQEELSRLSPPPPTSPPPPPCPRKVLEEGREEEEPKRNDSDLEDLIKIMYFGCLFDVKSQSEFTSTLLTRTHERGCCLTYDYVTEDATDFLGENDLDMISAMGGLLTSRPVYSGVSHKNALEDCIQRAKLWLQKSDEPIIPGAPVTYSGLREKLNKIMSLDYFTMTPEIKLPVDVASVVGKYNITMRAADAGVDPVHDENQIDDAYYQCKENVQEEFQVSEGSIDESSPQEENVNGYDTSAEIPSGDGTTIQQDEERVDADVEHDNPRETEHTEQQQHVPQRGYQNQRSGRGGGGRRGYYSNGRGGRGGRGGGGGGGGGGYQNGRGHQQYHEPGYYPRNYYNSRGRGGGRSGGSGVYSNNHGAAVQANGGRVEPQADS